MRRYCKHSQLTYVGMLAERHLGYASVFMDPEKEAPGHLPGRVCKLLIFLRRDVHFVNKGTVKMGDI